MTRDQGGETRVRGICLSGVDTPDWTEQHRRVQGGSGSGAGDRPAASGAGVHPWYVTPVSRFPKSRLIRVLRLTGGIPVPRINRRTGINRGNVTAGAGDPALCRPGHDREPAKLFATLQCADVQLHDPRPRPGGALRIPSRFLNTRSPTGTRPMGTGPPRPHGTSRPRGPAGYLRRSGPPSG